MRTRLGTLGLAALLALAGCASAEPGTPLAGERPTTAPGPTGAGPTSTSPSSAGPSSTGPSVRRPRPIDLRTVDICQVVARLPLRDYRLDGDRPPLGGTSAIFPGSADCFAGGIRENLSLLVVAVTGAGAASFVDGANVAARTDTTAAGYPLTVLTPHDPANCVGVVDVHDGQMLYLTYGLGDPTARPATPQPDLCRSIPAIAAATITAMG